MKVLVSLVCLVSALTLWASPNPDFIYSDLHSLNRVQSLSVGSDDLMDAGFVTSSGSEAFYVFPGEYEHYMHVSKDYSNDSYKVEIIEDEVLTTFTLNGQTTGKLQATTQKVDRTRKLSTDAGLEYWAVFNLVGRPSPVSVTIAKPFTGIDTIAQGMTRTGGLDYNACDGCEHGDQFLIDNINVVDLDFGDYYVSDCDGELQPLLRQLLTSDWDDVPGLGVPFTTEAIVSLNSSDLIEDTTSLWVADSRGSKLYIGTNTKLTLSMFLDSLVFRAAASLRTEAFEIKQDVMENGKFTSYVGTILTFEYKGVVIKTDLSTGRTVN